MNKKVTLSDRHTSPSLNPTTGYSTLNRLGQKRSHSPPGSPSGSDNNDSDTGSRDSDTTPPPKKATTKRVSTQKSVVIVTSNDEAAELLDYTYDFSTDGLLSEVPEKINTDDNSLVEIVAEGNLDLADLVDGM